MVAIEVTFFFTALCLLTVITVASIAITTSVAMHTMITATTTPATRLLVLHVVGADIVGVCCGAIAVIVLTEAEGVKKETLLPGQE